MLKQKKYITQQICLLTKKLNNMTDQKSHNKNKFLNVLLDILNNPDYSQIITWFNQNGFIIKLIQKFEEQVLPVYFNQRNINSFMRQLNMYGFKQKKDYKSAHKIYEHSLFSNNRAVLSKIERRREHKKIKPKRKKTHEQICQSQQEEISVQQSSDNNEHLKSSDKQKKFEPTEKYEQFMENCILRLEMLEYNNLRLCSKQQQYQAIVNNKLNITTNQINQIINILNFNITNDINIKNEQTSLQKNNASSSNQINTIQNFLSKSTSLNNPSQPKIFVRQLKEQYQQQQQIHQTQTNNIEPRKRKEKRTVSIKLENDTEFSLSTTKNFLKQPPLPSFGNEKISQE